MSWFSTRASLKVQEQNDRLLAENARLVKSNGQLDKALAEEIAVATQLESRCEDHRREHERQQHRIDALVEIKHGLDEELDAKAAFTRALEKQLDTALAQVKKLDAELVETAHELKLLRQHADVCPRWQQASDHDSDKARENR